MEKPLSQAQKIFGLLFLSLLLGCAVQMAPSGGPVDKIPPEILRTVPLSGAIHLPTDLAQIKIEFSERMQEGTERNNLFISPPVPFETHWKKGRILLVKLKDTLKAQQTYVLSVGSGLEDLHKNKMRHSFALAFSTGDTIDQGRIAGRIFGLKPRESFYVFAYALTDTSHFDPFSRKPAYVTLSGDKGKYVLEYLKSGKYRVIGVEDRNHNLLLDGISERFALTYRDVALHDSLNSVENLDMMVTQLDTTAPKLVGVQALASNLIRVRFSEPVRWDSLSALTLRDSLTGQRWPIIAMGKSNEKDNWWEIICRPLDSLQVYQLKCWNIADSSGNRSADTLLAYFTVKLRKDTTAFKLIGHLPADSARNVSPETRIKLEFNQPVNWNKVSARYRLRNDSLQTVSGKWQVENLYTAYFIPEKNLEPGRGYFSILTLKGLKSYLGKSTADSLSRHYFTIISNRELGEISGRIRLEPDHGEPVVLVLRGLKKKNFSRRRLIGSRRSFLFKFVPAGTYQIDGFVDFNLNRKLDRGRITPFEFCEPFHFGNDTISVRKRWETGGVLIQLPGKQ